MNAYQPNLKDPRVVKRIRHAFGYAKAVFYTDRPQCKSKLALNNQFGQAQHPLSQFLKNTLLTCVDHHFIADKKISKKYVLNQAGVIAIRQLLQGNIDIAFPEYTYPMIEKMKNDDSLFDKVAVNEFGKKEYFQELTSLEFNYEDKSNRLWHPIQMINREHKQNLLAEHGLKYHYDIEACAPTLLRQHAMSLNSTGNDNAFNEIIQYINNRQEVRKHISDECDVPQKIAKTTINALFCGAKLGCNAQFALTKVLGYDPARIMLMREMTTDLRTDIKDMWNEIKPTLTRKRSESGRLLAIQSKQKWAVYFQLEREVLNSVRRFLNKTNNKHFLEHDGWATEQMIDEVALLAHVKKETGFRIKVDLEAYDPTFVSDISEIPTIEGVTATQQQPTSDPFPTLSLRSSDTLVISSSKTNSKKDINIYKCAAPVQFPMCITSPNPILNKDANITWLLKYLRTSKLLQGKQS